MALPQSPPISNIPSDDSRRYIQVGSYADKDNARRVAERLEAAGINKVELDKIQANDRKLWRVRIGPLAQEKMDRVFARLREIGLPGTRVSGD